MVLVYLYNQGHLPDTLFITICSLGKIIKKINETVKSKKA